ncbi:hypothetical protein QQP08_027790, partial [Theobroma cacao]
LWSAWKGVIRVTWEVNGSHEPMTSTSGNIFSGFKALNRFAVPKRLRKRYCIFNIPSQVLSAWSSHLWKRSIKD